MAWLRFFILRILSIICGIKVFISENNLGKNIRLTQKEVLKV
ncbi:hypothetical protein [Senegalia massiliensis]|nr:hypothetical protein [Senegalia massiliensis]